MCGRRNCRKKNEIDNNTDGDVLWDFVDIPPGRRSAVGVGTCLVCSLDPTVFKMTKISYIRSAKNTKTTCNASKRVTVRASCRRHFRNKISGGREMDVPFCFSPKIENFKGIFFIEPNFLCFRLEIFKSGCKKSKMTSFNFSFSL